MTNKEKMIQYCEDKDNDLIGKRGELLLKVKGYIESGEFLRLGEIKDLCPKECGSGLPVCLCEKDKITDVLCAKCWKIAVEGDVEMDKKDNVTKLGDKKKAEVQENGTDTYIKTLIGKRVGVTVYDNNRDIYGELESLTYDNEGILEGIVLKEWGWLRWECVIRINEFRSKTER